jgi:hypothetical protein
MPMISVMFWSRSHAALRRGSSAVAIAFFLGGANFCVLSALQGAPMGCLGVGDTSGAKVSHCGHAMADETASGEDGQPLAVPMSSPCCLDVTLVAVPHLDKADAGITPVVLPAAATFTVAPPAVTSNRDFARDESPPPRPDLRVAPPGRAPPLA